MEGQQMTGGCYCGAIRYAITGAPRLKAQCHCRACQSFSGGGPNYFMLIPPEGFEITKGAPKTFTKPDKENAVTRTFCGTCGTHLTTLRPGLAETVVKVGTLDAPSQFGGPKIAIYCEEKAGFHVIPDGIPAFDRLPPQR